MKFSTSTILSVSLAMVGSSLAAPAPAPEPVQLSVRNPSPGECVSIFKFDRGTYHGIFDQSCVNLVENCRFTVGGMNTSDIWGIKSCVAAATCQGVTPLIEMVQCTPGGESVPEASQTESLDYNIYASIVGDCAWQEGGCPITQQNYIDFVYGALSEIGTSTWPDVNNVITNWWDFIKQWTATGDTVPYLNFNDWLRFSNSQ
ncbi:hypothetical protein K435DRAFT_785625 [Dendrothele bispora CBS 962.96]|uniref:Uncharacterized protein n=1 Tax=Dendrothele bispora (strain CBS 962.96) TaxID=1314807 RepID=A0A4S8KVR1_DENBC|nr:hypothetical protein K435DRAFT_785625 [Dendrothele bispora CBS 962.96]